MLRDSRSRRQSWGKCGAYANARITFLFATAACCVAFIANWNGSPDPLVIWIGGISSSVLLLLSIAARRKP